MAVVRRVAAALTAAIGSVVIVAAPAEAATVFTVKGTQTGHPAPYPEQLLPRVFANDTVTRIDYPAAILGMDASIAVATAGIVEAVQSAVGPVVVAGFSQGAVAVAHAKQVLMSLRSAPARENLSFITIGDPAGPGGILGVLPFRVPILDLSPITAPDTPYDSVIVNGEYDGWADFPDRPLNLISVLNAALGIAYVHSRYETIPGGLDIAGVPATNITTTVNSLGGRTTKYLIPTPQLPLVQPLRDLGIPESLVAALEKPLKTIVDAGYTRNDAPWAATAAPPRPALALSARIPVAASDPPTAAAIELAPTATPKRGRAALLGPVAAAATPVATEPAGATTDRPTKTGSRQSHSARRPAA